MKNRIIYVGIFLSLVLILLTVTTIFIGSNKTSEEDNITENILGKIKSVTNYGEYVCIYLENEDLANENNNLNKRYSIKVDSSTKIENNLLDNTEVKTLNLKEGDIVQVAYQILDTTPLVVSGVAESLKITN